MGDLRHYSPEGHRGGGGPRRGATRPHRPSHTDKNTRSGNSSSSSTTHAQGWQCPLETAATTRSLCVDVSARKRPSMGICAAGQWPNINVDVHVDVDCEPLRVRSGAAGPSEGEGVHPLSSYYAWLRPGSGTLQMSVFEARAIPNGDGDTTRRLQLLPRDTPSPWIGFWTSTSPWDLSNHNTMRGFLHLENTLTKSISPIINSLPSCSFRRVQTSLHDLPRSPNHLPIML